VFDVPILMLTDPNYPEEPDLAAPIIPFCSEECRDKYIAEGEAFSEENKFYETVSENGYKCVYCGR
jgi:hypothetical protein